MSIFSSVPTGKHSVSRYHWTPEYKVGFDFGPIYPILTKTVLPGDQWSISLQNTVRSMALLSPVMHRNDIKVDAFFVPFRLIWSDAEDWHKCVDETIRRPQLVLSSNSDTVYNLWYQPGQILDYLGFATIPATELSSRSIDFRDRKVCALPLRSYRMIYDYYFRNKEIEEAITDTFDPDFYGNNDNTLGSVASESPIWLGLQYRPWRRDLFTSALPTPQNGSDVLIPQPDLTSSTVITTGSRANATLPEEGPIHFGNQVGSTIGRYLVDDQGGPIRLTDSRPVVQTNSPTMRQLRYAEMLEEFEEAQARGGSSKGFKEWLKNIWNVNSSDARLDRPEYLGGYRGPVQISEIPQTGVPNSTSPTPVGSLAGKGLSIGGTRLFKKHFFEEPGILMVTMSVVPKSAYQQGDPREWLYESPFDFPNPYFDHLGEQEVFKQEINALDYLIRGKGTFGYNVRYYEMKCMPDEVHGKLRSDLAFWHEGRIFNWANTPGLNKEFLKVYPSDVSRIFPSSETSNKLIGQFYFDIKCKRNLSLYGLPHF